MEQTNIGADLDYNHSYNEYVAPNYQLEKTLLPFYQCPSAGPLSLTTCCGAYVAYDGTQHVAEMHYAGIATHTEPGDFPGYGWTSAGSGCLYIEFQGQVRRHYRRHQPDPIGYRTDTVSRHRSLESLGRSWCVPVGTRELGESWAGISHRGHVLWNQQSVGMNSQQSGVQSSHAGGANFVFADGHVAMLSENIRLPILWALTTRGPGRHARRRQSISAAVRRGGD